MNEIEDVNRVRRRKHEDERQETEMRGRRIQAKSRGCGDGAEIEAKDETKNEKGQPTEAVTGNVDSCSRGIAACLDCSVGGTELSFGGCRNKSGDRRPKDENRRPKRRGTKYESRMRELRIKTRTPGIEERDSCSRGAAAYLDCMV